MVFLTISLLVISSGNLHPVLDGGGGHQSIFSRALLASLIGMSKPFTATELYTDFNKEVVKDAARFGVEQTPIMSSLNQAGHLGPDYVFYYN